MPGERLSMRKIREVLRLRFGQGLSQRAIGQSLQLSVGAVNAYLSRSRMAGLSWPLPAELDDAQLETLLYPPPRAVASERRPAPDWAVVHRELRRPNVTVALLWEEYRTGPGAQDGFGYSWFCDLYREWVCRLKPTLRQVHTAGERVYVDFAGHTMEVIDGATGEIRRAEIFVAVLGASRSLSEKWRILVAAFARIGFCLLMSKTFRPWTIDQPLLLPPSVQDFVGEDHLARFILALVLEHLDLGEIESAYASERGQPPFDPAMMTALLLYGYCHGVYSSRRIAKATRERVDFMSIVGLDPPDFRTVSDFRKRHLKALAGLFGQVLKLCEQAGFVKLGHVALDGTKIKANASKHKAMSYERMEKRAAELEAEVERWLSAAEAADAEEDRAFGRDKSGEELPKWVADKKKRAEKIRAAKAELEAEAKAAAAAKAKAQAEAEERRQAEGRKKPGKPAAPPSEEPDPKAQKNFTDPESRIMKTKDGFIQGYNAQAAVDATAQVIVAHGLDAKQSDQHQLAPIADAIEANLGKKPTQLSADAGYCSDANLAAMEEREIDAYIAPGRAKHAGEGEGGGARVAAMRERIKAGGHSSPYRLRKQLPEPVFGQIKQARGFRQFLLRGVEKVANEWGLVCLAHNILKLAQGRTPSLAALATG